MHRAVLLMSYEIFLFGGAVFSAQTWRESVTPVFLPLVTPDLCGNDVQFFDILRRLFF